MKWFPILIAALLIGGHWGTEIGSVIYEFKPELRNKTYDWFWAKDYHYQLQVYWYIYFTAQDLLEIIFCFCLAKIAYRVNDTLFYVCLVFFVYHIVNALGFWYDCNQSRKSMWAFLFFCSLATLMFFVPSKHKMKIIR